VTNEAQRDSLSFNVMPPFRLSGALLGNDATPFVVGVADGVVRTNMYLRDSWSGRRFHFRVAIAERHSDHAASSSSAASANLTVCDSTECTTQSTTYCRPHHSLPDLT